MPAAAEPGLDPGLVFEVIVTRPGELRDFRGSGYQVTSEALLTAAHVVAGAASVRVRCNADRADEWTAAGTVLWTDDGADLALVGIPVRADRAVIPPVAFGRVADRDGVLHCTAVGFPRFKLRADRHAAHPSRYRDSVHVIGDIAVFSNRRQGTFALTVPAPEADPDPTRSPWEGMSGAAVWSAGTLIGVVTEHHVAEGLATLTASRADRWHERLGHEQVQRLQSLIRFPADAGLLVAVAVNEDPAIRAAHERRRMIDALMQAESGSLHNHPYRLPADAPGLDRVYVEPFVVERPGPGDERRVAGAEEPIPVSEAFAAHQRLIIQGGPGQGKSTVVKHVAATFARDWLADADSAQPALLVPAVDLAGPAPLASLLRASVLRRFGPRLRQDLPEMLFASAVAEIPWLLLVDGLDEITNPAMRQHVMHAIAVHAGDESAPYQWAVTTRPHPDQGLEPLLDAGFHVLSLVPFTDEQVELLAVRWFTGTPGLATAFLGQMAANRAAPVIRTPLLATIAMVLFRRNPGEQPVPGRPAMYQQFITHLLSGRDGEPARREALHRAVVDAGGPTSVADWLTRSRIDLLTDLADQTLAGTDRLQESAVAWTARHAPESVEFVHDWPQIVATLLAGTGLLVRDGDGDEFRWLHRSFAEYLAARRAAAGLPDDWPGEEFDRDPVLQAALLGTDGEVPLLTIAIWATRAGAATEQLLGGLLRRSGGYRVYRRRPKTMVRFGNDSNEADYYAAFAGHLLAEGIPAAQPLAAQLIDRLVERASSMFNGQEFCTILSALPDREPIRERLERLATDESQPVHTRAAAVIAIVRTSGWSAAEAAARSLLQPVGRTQRLSLLPNGSGKVLGVGDGRTIAAEQLATLGPVAHGLVREILELVDRGPHGDSNVVADILLALGENDRAIELVRSVGSAKFGAADAVLVLLQAGEVPAALEIVDGLLAALDHTDEDQLRTLQNVATEAFYFPAHEIAWQVVTSVLNRLGRHSPAWAYTVGVELGVPPAEVVRVLHEANGRPDHWTWYDWTGLVRSLFEHGAPDEAGEAVDLVIEQNALDGEAREIIGTMLVEQRDRRGPQLCLAAAADEECPVHMRVAAAEALLGSADHDRAVELLRHIAQGPLDISRGSADLTADLVRLGYSDEAVALLEREVTDTVSWGDLLHFHWSTRRMDAIEALDILAPAALKRLLLRLDERDEVATTARIDMAETLDRFGEPARAAVQGRRLVEEYTPADVPVDAEEREGAPWDTPAALVRIARLLYRLGDPDGAADACRRALWWAATGTTSLNGVDPAVEYLDKIGGLGPDEAKLIRTICVNVLQGSDTELREHADAVVQLILWLARNVG